MVASGVTQCLQAQLQCQPTLCHREVALSDLDSLPYLDAVVRESLRLYPPAPFTTREAGTDIEVEGMFFPKGTSIVLALYSMLRDPEVFPEPDKFKPERWLAQDPRWVVCECDSDDGYAHVPATVSKP